MFLNWITGYAHGGELAVWWASVGVVLACAAWVWLAPVRRRRAAHRNAVNAMAFRDAGELGDNTSTPSESDRTGLAETTPKVTGETAVVLQSSELIPVPMPPYMGDPREDEATIRELLRRSGGWTERRYPQPGTTVRVYVRAREYHADLVVVWTLAYAGACRLVVTAEEDPLVAEFATWHWVGRAVDAVKQICGLALPPHGVGLQPLPVACRPPNTMPVILRPPQ